MIKGNIAKEIKSDNSNVRKALLWLKDYEGREPGVYEIQGREIYAIVQEYGSKDMADLKWEAHRRYIDIQFIQSGKEQIGVAPLQDMKIDTEYDEEGDYAFYNGTGRFYDLSTGDYMILFPEDAHMPGRGDGSPVKKVVVKVAL